MKLQDSNEQANQMQYQQLVLKNQELNQANQILETTINSLIEKLEKEIDQACHREKEIAILRNHNRSLLEETIKFNSGPKKNLLNSLKNNFSKISFKKS